MKTAHRATLAAFLLLPALAFAQAGPVRPDRAFAPGGDSPALRDFGPLATDTVGAQYIARLEAKWGGIMRRAKGWNESSFRQFRQGYRNYPVSVLEKALAAETYDAMMASFRPWAAAKAQSAMRKAYALDALKPGDADVPEVMEAASLAAKTLGEDAKDLVFIPITPCTVWDTRFASDGNSAGIIANGVTKKFYTHLDGADTAFDFWGGNPSCPEAAQDTIGGRPYAAMMTVFTNDATGNGWVTVYRDGDPDPSQASISVYYAAGPTRTQTVIAKSSRGYGTGAYDVAVTSRFGSVHVAAVVTGYFIKPQATALDCTSTYATQSVGPNATFNIDIPACATGYTLTGAGCSAPGFNSADWTIGGVYPITFGVSGAFCTGQNRTGGTISIAGGARCCRVPGR